MQTGRVGHIVMNAGLDVSEGAASDKALTAWTEGGATASERTRADLAIVLSSYALGYRTVPGTIVRMACHERTGFLSTICAGTRNQSGGKCKGRRHAAVQMAPPTSGLLALLRPDTTKANISLNPPHMKQAMASAMSSRSTHQFLDS